MNAVTTRKFLAVASLAAASAASAALVPLSPAGGKTVARVPEAQKTVMAPTALQDRIAVFREDRERGGKKLLRDKRWRKPLPLVLSWRATEGETGPWKIEISTDPLFENSIVRYVRANGVDPVSGRETDKAEEGLAGEKMSYTVPCANLEIGRDYFWRVTGLSKPADGEKSGAVVRSEPAAFVTEDRPPRWIEIEGRVGNIRDFGGWRTEDGRRVRQGMAFRGQGLNDNSVTGESQGPNRLTVEDVKFFTRTLGIKTDLDLRGKKETADLDESPLGPGVRFVQHSSPCYRGIFTKDGKKTMAENVRVFCDPASYPIYFHCIGGADRTGSLAYMMLGYLGVPRHDIETDWESTFYPNIPDDIRESEPGFWCRESHFTDGLMKYGAEGDSWQRRIELYFLDCGLTPEELGRLRDLMLE